jgi:hypothetical protein
VPQFLTRLFLAVSNIAYHRPGVIDLGWIMSVTLGNLALTREQ